MEYTNILSVKRESAALTDKFTLKIISENMKMVLTDNFYQLNKKIPEEKNRPTILSVKRESTTLTDKFTLKIISENVKMALTDNFYQLNKKIPEEKSRPTWFKSS